MTFRVLVTGCAGFIGFHCAARLARDGHEVAGIDDLNDYYDVRLKQARLAELANVPGFRFSRMNIADSSSLDQLFAQFKPEYVLHLAAQAGVRHSLHNPRAYMESNLTGFFNILEACRRHRPLHLVFASSSSVYGARAEVPFTVAERTDEPVSFYAATKKANEVMAYSYSHLHGIATTGLRFFTVYGPWGRPDMAYFSFTKAILAGRAIDIFNHGRMQRDFTYIDDIVEGVVRVLARAPGSAGGSSVSAAPQGVPYKLYNIGNSSPVRLLDFVETLEALLGRTTPKNFLPMQPGDVPVTYADTADLASDIGFVPATPLRAGLERFVAWYRSFNPGSDGQT
jgi:UDP-glucuronate 4-epimerase